MIDAFYKKAKQICYVIDFFFPVKPDMPSLIINDENIQEYQIISLTCSSFNGNPPPQYAWSRNGTLLTYK